MPVVPLDGDDSAPVVTFDPRLEVSPFELFRRIREGRAPLLFDLRDALARGPEGQERLALRGAEPFPGPPWTPPADQDVVLLDDDGTAAVVEARRLQAAGHPRVRALFGGLALYEFSLDPEVVGEDTGLERRGP
jgi:hypothetical protein